MVDEKDRFGDKLRQKEKAEEDRFFAERDRALLAKLRDKPAAAPATPARCPACGDELAAVSHHGVSAAECPRGDGVWLDRGALESLAEREQESWLGRFFARPKR